MGAQDGKLIAHAYILSAEHRLVKNPRGKAWVFYISYKYKVWVRVIRFGRIIRIKKPRPDRKLRSERGNIKGENDDG